MDTIYNIRSNPISSGRMSEWMIDENENFENKNYILFFENLDFQNIWNFVFLKNLNFFNIHN
jgi:hypothetical protein